MAITIDYSNPAQYVIQIPKADMTLVSSSPTEIRELNINTLRVTLGDLQDDAEGMPYPTAFVHTAPLTVAGVTLARVVEILDPYVIEFEDGAYNVNITGGNSNVSDVTIKNQVGVNTSNSAGLTYSKEVEDQSFTDSRVWIDVDNGVAETAYPAGTPGRPVNNLTDAQTIISARILPKRLHLRGTLTVTGVQDISGYSIKGASTELAFLTISSGANTAGLVTETLTFNTGDFSGDLTARECSFHGVVGGVEGTLRGCSFLGNIYLANGGVLVTDSCYSEVPGLVAPIFVFGTNNQIVIRHYSGGLEFQGMTAGCTASVDIAPGTLTMGATNTGGIVNVRGVGDVQNSAPNATIYTAALLNTADVLRILDIQEADEDFSGTKAYKRHKVTKAVLIEKDVAGGSIIPVTLTEP